MKLYIISILIFLLALLAMDAHIVVKLVVLVMEIFLCVDFALELKRRMK